MRKQPALIYQRKDYTCGIACLQTAARLLGKPVFPAAFMEKRLGTNPEIGTRKTMMIDWAKRRLPFESAGENLWNGQLAIAFTTVTTDDGHEEGHYEVFLGKLRGRIVSWCPYDATVRVLKENEIDWRTPRNNPLWGDYVRWSLNLKHRYSERELLKFLGLTGTERLCLPKPASAPQSLQKCTTAEDRV